MKLFFIAVHLNYKNNFMVTTYQNKIIKIELKFKHFCFSYENKKYAKDFTDRNIEGDKINKALDTFLSILSSILDILKNIFV